MEPLTWMYLGIGLVACQIIPFIVYGFDKRRAINGKSRVSEFSLILLTFLFGIAGSYLAMILFRHKTIKGSFKTKFIVASIFRVLILGGVIAILLIYF